jgi:hypothetical protein
MPADPICRIGTVEALFFWTKLGRTPVILGKECPLIDKDYAYFKQTLKSPLAIGEEFSRVYHEWAWGDGRNQFPDTLLQESVPANAYIKFKIAEHLASITPTSMAAITDPAMRDEIAVLMAIKPHAIVTTNYDRFLEMMFPDYDPVIGQKVISGSSVLVGELFEIHGCVSDPTSLVLTQEDYDNFMKKQK